MASGVVAVEGAEVEWGVAEAISSPDDAGPMLATRQTRHVSSAVGVTPSSSS